MCDRVPLEGGGYAIVCRSRKKHAARVRCQICLERMAEVECDGPVSVGRKFTTCDLAMCRQCAKHEEPNRDFCPQHDAPEKRRMSL